jgi:2-polyprenyl-3-methyl-5-hydroxy-6-metoxy-1,4-benzoquinol methylase
LRRGGKDTNPTVRLLALLVSSPRRLLRTVIRRGRGIAVDAGLLTYRRPYSLDAAQWNQEYESGVLEHYADLEALPRYSVLIGYMGVHDGSPTVLDVGCGVGLLRARMAGVRFTRYVGIDPSSSAIERARELEDERTKFIVSERPTSTLGSYDVVVCNEVLYYVDDVEEFLDAVAQVLKPGGLFLTSIWRHPGDSALHRMVDKRFELVARHEVTSLTKRGRRYRVACHRRP